MGWLGILIVAAGAALALWLLSLILEALRPRPEAPAVLRWAPDIPIEYMVVGGARLRFIKTGEGPALVLLHTLRTQLDLFEKIVPALSQHFTVYALDYPGHGYSDIPKARYDASFFTDAVEGFLEAAELRDVVLAGVSIGGVIPLIVAARHNPRVIRVVAINPYDYAAGRGMARSSLLGWISTYAALIPVIGETWMRLRSFMIMRPVLLGGVADPDAISPALMAEMYRVGNRPGHLSGLPQPHPECRELRARPPGLWPDRTAGLADLGGSRLVACLRARKHALTPRQRGDEDDCGRRPLPAARSAGRIVGAAGLVRRHPGAAYSLRQVEGPSCSCPPITSISS